VLPGDLAEHDDFSSGLSVDPMATTAGIDRSPSPPQIVSLVNVAAAQVRADVVRRKSSAEGFAAKTDRFALEINRKACCVICLAGHGPGYQFGLHQDPERVRKLTFLKEGDVISASVYICPSLSSRNFCIICVATDHYSNKCDYKVACVIPSGFCMECGLYWFNGKQHRTKEQPKATCDVALRGKVFIKIGFLIRRTVLAGGARADEVLEAVADVFGGQEKARELLQMPRKCDGIELGKWMVEESTIIPERKYMNGVVLMGVFLTSRYHLGGGTLEVLDWRTAPRVRLPP